MSSSGCTRRLLAGHQRSLLDHPSLQPALLLVSAQRLLGGALRLGSSWARRARPSGYPALLAAASSPSAATAGTPTAAPTASATATPASATASPPVPSAASLAGLASPAALACPEASDGPAEAASATRSISATPTASQVATASPAALVSTLTPLVPATALGSSVVPAALADPAALDSPSLAASPRVPLSPLTQASPLLLASPAATVSFLAASPSAVGSPEGFAERSPEGTSAATSLGTASNSTFDIDLPSGSEKSTEEPRRGGPVFRLVADSTAPPAAAPPRCPSLPDEGLGGGAFAGQGSYGEVRETSMPGYGQVAIKRGTGDQAAVGNVADEAETLLSIRSGFVVQCQARLYSREGRCTGFVMPAATMSLERLLRERFSRMTVLGATDILRQMAGGLADTHDAGFVHLDVKPSNVLIYEVVGASGCVSTEVRLCDYGLALRTSILATYDACWCCTITTKAPELFLGRAFPASDVFSWGVTAALLLSGDASGSSLYGPGADIRAAVLSGKRAQLPPLCPAELSSIITRSMLADPAARPSAAELFDELEAYLDEPGRGAALSRLTLPALWS